MENNKSEIIVTGSYYFYPVNEVARDILAILDKKTFSKRTLAGFKKYFSVKILQEENKIK